jgi:hypothetical protein
MCGCALLQGGAVRSRSSRAKESCLAHMQCCRALCPLLLTLQHICDATLTRLCLSERVIWHLARRFVYAISPERDEQLHASSSVIRSRRQILVLAILILCRLLPSRVPHNCFNSIPLQCNSALSQLGGRRCRMLRRRRMLRRAASLALDCSLTWAAAFATSTSLRLHLPAPSGHCWQASLPPLRRPLLLRRCRPGAWA